MLLRESILLGFPWLKKSFVFLTGKSNIPTIPYFARWCLASGPYQINAKLLHLHDSIPKKLDYMEPEPTSYNTFCWDYLDSHRTFSFFSALVMHFSYVFFVLPHHDYFSEPFYTVSYQGRFSSVGRNNETSSKGKMYHNPYQQY